MSLFAVGIETLSGIGIKTAERFRKIGLSTVGGLISYYPRAYEDWRTTVPVLEAENGHTCCIKVQIESFFSEGYSYSGKLVSKFTAFDDSGTLELIFFNNRYIKDILKCGKTYYVLGKISKDLFKIQMYSPSFVPEKQCMPVLPVYKLTSGLTNRMVQNAVKAALDLLPQKIKDTIPENIKDKYQICDLDFAIRNIHFPDSMESITDAKNRLAFEELLILNLGLSQFKNLRKQEKNIHVQKDWSEEFNSLLPFSMTESQKKVIDECVYDICHKKSPMNRLIQGDVGSGKTAVASSVMFTVIKNGYQAAFMAPTEILAQQHYQTLSKLLEGTGIRLSLLTGSMSPGQKKKLREQLAEGMVDLVIGTHSLITDATVFKALGIVVTDEQHRFGVSQRTKLADKGENPHLLVMSATPIPRTMALTIFGDLDISVISEMPKGRMKTETYLIDSSKRTRAYNFIKKHILMGRQCCIVCPVVENGESNLASAEGYAAELRNGVFKGFKVGLIHGKMKSADKDKAMEKFAQGETSLLVATTVIEVGIDVPNAVVIMIENAERFGLSQLHQLRGRVGRGTEQSFCILLSDAEKEETLQRLKIMCQTNDGFLIADADLQFRGPGDFFGQRQHGLPELSVADFSDMNHLKKSKDAAKDILEISPDLNHESLKGLKAEIRRLFKDTDISL